MFPLYHHIIAPGAYLFPGAQILWVGVPVDLGAHWVVQHAVEVGDPYAGCVEELSPQQLAVQGHRWSRMLLLHNKSSCPHFSVSSDTMRNINRARHRRFFRLHFDGVCTISLVFCIQVLQLCMKYKHIIMHYKHYCCDVDKILLWFLECSNS